MRRTLDCAGGDPPLKSTRGWVTASQVFQGRILSEYITSTGIAGKAFLRRLELLVERFGRVPNDTAHKGEARVALDLVEEIRSRACFVHPEAVVRSTQGIEGDDEGTDLANVLRRAYERTTRPDTKPTSFERGGSRWLVPAWVKERTAEVYFEPGEGDEGVSLPEAVAGCLVKVSKRPMDRLPVHHGIDRVSNAAAPDRPEAHDGG